MLKIDARIGKYTLDLDLADGLAVVTGYSATGKTFIAKLLKDIIVIAESGNNEWLGKDITWAKELIFLDGHSTIRDIKLLLQEKERMIIIDNANYLCQRFPELVHFINHDIQNSYLIFGRPSFGVSFCAGPAHLKFEDNTFTLEYVEG